MCYMVLTTLQFLYSPLLSGPSHFLNPQLDGVCFIILLYRMTVHCRKHMQFSDSGLQTGKMEKLDAAQLRMLFMFYSIIIIIQVYYTIYVPGKCVQSMQACCMHVVSVVPWPFHVFQHMQRKSGKAWASGWRYATASQTTSDYITRLTRPPDFFLHTLKNTGRPCCKASVWY